MAKATIRTLGDFTADPDRPGTKGRYQAVYEARDQAKARAQMAQDETAFAAIGKPSATIKVVSARWTPPTGRFGKGRLLAIFDTCDLRPGLEQKA
jgi:hypothetical protein